MQAELEQADEADDQADSLEGAEHNPLGHDGGEEKAETLAVLNQGFCKKDWWINYNNYCHPKTMLYDKFIWYQGWRWR